MVHLFLLNFIKFINKKILKVFCFWLVLFGYWLDCWACLCDHSWSNVDLEGCWSVPFSSDKILSLIVKLNWVVISMRHIPYHELSCWFGKRLIDDNFVHPKILSVFSYLVDFTLSFHVLLFFDSCLFLWEWNSQASPLSPAWFDQHIIDLWDTRLNLLKFLLLEFI